MVIGHGLKLVAIGLVLGIGVSYGVGRAIASLLYQTESHDIVTFGTVPIVLLLIAVIACALPAFEHRGSNRWGSHDGMNRFETALRHVHVADVSIGMFHCEPTGPASGRSDHSSPPHPAGLESRWGLNPASIVNARRERAA